MKKPEPNSEWCLKFDHEMGTNQLKEALRLIELSESVSVFATNETGEDQWVVAPDEDEGYWLNTFEAVSAAVSFCKEMGWPFVVTMEGDVE